jgi:hypothetical protein
MRLLTIWTFDAMIIYAVLGWWFYTDYKVEPNTCYHYEMPEITDLAISRARCDENVKQLKFQVAGMIIESIL